MNGGARRLNSAGEEHGERRGCGGEPGQGADRQHRQEAGRQPHDDHRAHGRDSSPVISLLVPQVSDSIPSWYHMQFIPAKYRVTMVFGAQPKGPYFGFRPKCSVSAEISPISAEMRLFRQEIIKIFRQKDLISAQTPLFRSKYLLSVLSVAFRLVSAFSRNCRVHNAPFRFRPKPFRLITIWHYYSIQLTNNHTGPVSRVSANGHPFVGI